MLGVAWAWAAAVLLPCPATRWDVKQPLPQPSSSKHPFLHTVRLPAGCRTAADEHAWLTEHAGSLLERLECSGAIHFRGFSSPRTKPGFRAFCNALPLQQCADPLASVGVRRLISADDGVYAAVDAEALASTFIGLHNDATYKRAAPFAAFACFRQAETGGEFLVANGRQVPSLTLITTM